MAARAYRRETHDQIREAERVRTAGLLALSGADDARRLGWIAAGVSVADARAELEREADERRRRLAAEVRPVEGHLRLAGGAATCAMLTMMNRPDLAARHAEAAVPPVRDPILWLGSSREGFERLLGQSGPALDVWSATLDGLDQAAHGRDRVALSAGVGTVAALPAGSLGAALRDASQIVIRDNWERGGSFWMRAVRPVQVRDFKPTRVWWTRTGDVAATAGGESGPPRRASDESSEAWPWVDLQAAADAFDAALVLTRERAVNAGDGGAAEIAAHFASQIAAWHDRLDREVVSALSSAPSVEGYSSWPAAISALNRQTIGDMTLGSAGRPWALAGDNHRAAVQAHLPTSDSDQAALLAGASFSSAVDADTLILVHGAFRPCAIAHLGDDLISRPPGFGRVAGVEVAGNDGRRVVTPAGVRLLIDASAVKAIHVGPAPNTDSIVGAVRLVARG